MADFTQLCVTLIIFNISSIYSIFDRDIYTLKRRLYVIVLSVINLIVISISVWRIDTRSIHLRDAFNPTQAMSLYAIAIIAGLFIFFWRTHIDEEKLDDYHVKFTDEIDEEDAVVRIFAGSLSFLGRVNSSNQCIGVALKKKSQCEHKKQMLEKEFCNNHSNKCKNINGFACFMISKQYQQIVQSKSHGVQWEILCKESDNIHNLAILGKLIYLLNDKITIRFYNRELRDSVYIFARIKRINAENPMLWFWKAGENKYTRPTTYKKTEREKNPMGDTLFYLVDTLLWDLYDYENKEKECELRKRCVKAFFEVIGIKEGDQAWKDYFLETSAVSLPSMDSME